MMDVWHNVCMEGQPQRKQPILLHSYAGGAGGVLLVNMERVLFGRAVDHNASDWPRDVQEAEALYDEPTLYVLDFGFNVAHCLNDAVLPLTTASLFNRLPTRFIVGGWESFSVLDWHDSIKEASGSAAWCHQMLEWTGAVPATPESHPPSSPRAKLCFRELHMPRYVASRHLIRADLQEGMREVRRRAFRAIEEDGWMRLNPDPWPKEPTQTIRVHFYDRRFSKRRHVVNSTMVKHYLEAHYDAEVILLEEAFEQANITEQARLFNSVSHLICPHGAHLANLIFSRPATRVVEIVCATNERQFRANEIMESNTDNKKWYNVEGTELLQQWFSRNSKALGIEHFHYFERDGCRVGGRIRNRPPEQITVDVENFSRFVASRLQLKRRDA
jgi:hypothetical protein